MSGPWERFQQPSSKPWERYQPDPRREALLRKRAELDAELESMTLGGTVKDIGKALDDNVRLAANGMSFGFLDKALGQDERAKTNAARDRQGMTGMASEALGSMALPMGAAKAGLTVANLPVRGAMIAAPTVEGAGYGAMQALGNDKNVLEGAGYGAGFGLLGQTVGAGIGKGYAALHKPSVPSLDDIVAQKNATYAQVDASGAQYTPEQLAVLSQGISDDMAAGKMHPAINPKVAAVNDIIAQDLSRGPMTLSELDRTRQVVGNKVFQNAPTADDARLGGQMLQNFDEFVDATPPALGGDNAAVVEALKRGRELNTRASKTKTIMDALDKAERRASVTGSGGNIDNATRQKINAIIDNPKMVKKFSSAEQAMMRRIADGTEVGNKMRLVGKLSPSGNGLMAALSIGGAAANPLLSIPPLVGIGAKAIGDRTTRKLVEELLASVKTGGNYKPAQMPQAKREQLQAVIRALSMGGTTAAINAN